jgi:ubiquinone/menaquinone biosynthesis C-methylase UbiE
MEIMKPVYDEIGIHYSKYRKADYRIVEKITGLLNLPEKSIVAEVGAGTGNYSYAIAEKGYYIKAVEPSDVMIKQRKTHPSIEWIKGQAEDIPLGNKSVDAVIGILSVHHFSNLKKSLEEMSRISSKGPILFFTYDPRQIDRWWLADYFPFLWDDSFKFFLPIDELAEKIHTVTNRHMSIHTFELPHDLTDYFAAAGWRRPEIYLDPIVRSCISSFATVDRSIVEKGVNILRADLNSGEWDRKYGRLKTLNRLDLGYRFVLAKSGL